MAQSEIGELWSLGSFAIWNAGKSGGGNLEPIEAIRYLIGLEIEENPQEVGGPVDILQIDRHGPKWIQKKEGCPEIR
jgi:hypothetical protein